MVTPKIRFQRPLLCWTRHHRSPVFLIRAQLTIVGRIRSAVTFVDVIPGSPGPTPFLLGQLILADVCLPREGSRTPTGPAPFTGPGAQPGLEVHRLADSGKPWRALRLEWRYL